MLPQNENRRGCYIIMGVVVLAAAVLLWISSTTSDRAQVNEAVSAGGPGRPATAGE